jgi:predicted phage terminase large subunit-like protein
MPKRPPSKFSSAEALRAAEQITRALELKADAEYCEQDLKFFLECAWPFIQPGVPFQDNWHISCLCDHLEALTRREIRRMIINVPPRSLKSTIISVAFPAWRWLTAPQEKFLAASYGLTVARRDSRRCRNLIASQWFQARWGSRFQLAGDQNEKGRFENDKGGFRIIASVEGGVLGEGGSVVLIDDPNDLEKMNKEPETYPQSVREWYSGSMSSRNIDPKTDVRLCVQQRASYGGDLTEYLLELGGWEQVVIPNEWEGAKTIGPLGYADPRTKHGELMFPARLGPEETDLIKREQKTHYAGQYQQKPTVGGKNGLRREWFRFYNPPGMGVTDMDGKAVPIRMSLGDGTFANITPVELPPAFEQVVQSWDMTFKAADENDFVAGHAWGRIGSNSYLLERDTEHRTFVETLAAMRRMAERVPCPEKLVEDKANGPAVIDTLKNEIPGLIPVTPSGGKWSRVAAISGYVEAGNVHLPNPDLFPWVWDLLAEFAAGQAAKHDDDTDAMSQALKRLYDASARAGVPEFRIAPRLGEPQNAVHISRDRVPVDCRRFVAAIPGRAAIWVAELRSGALRVTAELNLEKLDALVAGREIARRILPDILARVVPITGRRPGYEIFLPKRAFAPMEAVGSWAEMMEMALLAFEPEEGDWDGRNRSRAALQSSRIRTDMVEEEEGAALDRLRGLLAFQPPDFRSLPYDREKALRLAEEDLGEYHRYLGMVEGRVVGEWPKIKIHPSCTGLIADLGAFRKDVPPAPFVEALLLAVCAPRTVPDAPDIRETAWPQTGRTAARGATLLARKFARR